MHTTTHPTPPTHDAAPTPADAVRGHLSTPPQTGPTRTPTPTPAELGVGARITLSVMSSGYVRIITEALAQTSTDGLTVETDPVSTRVAGTEQRIAEYLSDLVSAAARSGEHVSASVMLSRGCPGEVTCDLPGDQPFPAAAPVTLTPTGVHAVAQWALYPLADQPLAPAVGGPGTGGSAPAPDHMRDIYAAIEQARAAGTMVGSDHYVTRLAGDVADVLSTVVSAWVAVGRTVRHVTTHVTLSLNSPSLATPRPRGGSNADWRPVSDDPASDTPAVVGPATSGLAGTEDHADEAAR